MLLGKCNFIRAIFWPLLFSALHNSVERQICFDLWYELYNGLRMFLANQLQKRSTSAFSSVMNMLGKE